MQKTFTFGDVSRACSLCRRDHKACNGARPCQRCTASGMAHLCEDIPLKKRGRPVRKKRPASATEAGVANFVSSFPQPTISPQQATIKTEECLGDISTKFKLLQQKLQSAHCQELQFHHIHPEPKKQQQQPPRKSSTTTKICSPPSCQSSSVLPSPPVSPTYRAACGSPTISPPSSPSTSASASSVLKKRKREAALPTVFVPSTPPTSSTLCCEHQAVKLPRLEERERNANAITVEERNAEEFVLEVTENRKACEGLLSELLSVFPEGIEEEEDAFVFDDNAGVTSFGFEEGYHCPQQQPQQQPQQPQLPLYSLIPSQRRMMQAQQPQQVAFTSPYYPPQQPQQPQQQVCQFEDLMPEGQYWIPSMFDGEQDRDGDYLSFFSTEESPFTSILC